MAPPPPTISLWSDFAGLVLTPITLYLISAGYGLLIVRIARRSLPPALIVGIGFCAAVIVSLGGYELHVGDPVVVPLVVIPALIGLALSGRRLPAELDAGWALVAALIAYVLFDAVVIGAGHWTLGAYNVANDSAYELSLVANLRVHGTATATGLPSTARTVINQYLSAGYPLGGQSLLAVTGGLLGVSGAVVWQGFMSASMAIATLVASTLSTRTMGPKAAAAAALVALSAVLAFQYALQGAIKETTTLVGVLTALAVMREGVLRREPVLALVAAVPLGAIMAAYNAAGLPYVGATGAAGVLALLALNRPRPDRSWIKPVVGAGALLVVLCVPALLTLQTFFTVAKTGYTGAAATAPSLGPLLRPLPLSEISGVWLTGDYRLPVPPGLAGDVTVLTTLAVVGLLVLGVWRALRAREPGTLMGLFTVGLVLVVVYPRVIPYAQSKLLVIGSPLVVLGALQGLTGLRRPALRVGAGAVAVALAGTVFASDALAYRTSPVLPSTRMLALEQIGHWLGRRGPVLDSEFEQFAKVFSYPAPLIDGPDSPTPEALDLLTPVNEYDQSFDLNAERVGFVESFPYVLTRRSALTTRPPANYRLVLENNFYDLWQRGARPVVLSALPVGGSDLAPQAHAECSAIRSLVRAAPPGSRLALWSLPPVAGFSLGDPRVRPAAWTPNGTTTGGFVATTPGVASSRVAVPRTGRYEIWVQGNLPRGAQVRLDGRAIGSAKGSNAPSEWLSAGYVDVRSGVHRLSVDSPGKGLGPGASGLNVISTVALAAAERPPEPTQVPLSRWKGVCGRSLSWVEVVKP